MALCRKLTVILAAVLSAVTLVPGTASARRSIAVRSGTQARKPADTPGWELGTNVNSGRADKPPAHATTSGRATRC